MLDCDYVIKANAYKDKQNIVIQWLDNYVSSSRVNFELSFNDFLLLVVASVTADIAHGGYSGIFRNKNINTYHKGRFSHGDTVELLMTIYGKKVKMLLCDAGANLCSGDMFMLKKLGIESAKKDNFPTIYN